MFIVRLNKKTDEEIQRYLCTKCAELQYSLQSVFRQSKSFVGLCVMPGLSSGNHKAGNIATGGLTLESIENPVHHYTVNWYLPRSIEMLTGLTIRWHFVQPGNGNRLRAHILSQTCNRCFNSSQSKLSLTLTKRLCY